METINFLAKYTSKGIKLGQCKKEHNQLLTFSNDGSIVTVDTNSLIKYQQKLAL